MSGLTDTNGAATPRPIVWSIAGSDSGGGAGIQADLRAFGLMGVHGCTAIAAVTAQNSVAVTHIEAVAPDVLDAQLAALAADLPPAVIKTGMLASADNVRVVARWVRRLRQDRPEAPVALVIDPVRRASTGAELGGQALREALLAELLPLATLVKPNQAEAAWLAGQGGHVSALAAQLRRQGAGAVVITGGDTQASEALPEAADWSLDWLDTPQAHGWLAAPRVATPHNHGTGCTFASTAAAALAHGYCEADAIVIAKMLATNGLRHGYAAGAGAGPVNAQAGFGLQADALPLLEPDLQRLPGSAHRRSRPELPPLASAWMGLYPVVDTADWVERVLAAGVRTVQLRIKAEALDALAVEGVDAYAYLDEQIARSVRAARAVNAQLFINDHWEAAVAHGAYGVHLGQEDLFSADLDAIRRAGLRLGLSTHSYWEVCRARAESPSYIACGPIHATVTKDMPWWPQGPGNLAYWSAALREPVVGIAGMDEARSLEAARCGAHGIAVLRGITHAPDPESAIAVLTRAIDAGRAAPPLAPPALARPTLRGPVAAVLAD
ncbi:MAG: Thiamine-phosphate synthase [Paracidovorax wautersii]|uniref:hydroxymethylpyrimidine kinase n=1 Tax=Paracidovorax wautersii TaxID=1177982 RepID=A0A7V8JRE3_9BURK|nr:MAG: Thiamine-phosphate synthase [Paracidovorax wautersii]